MPELDQRIYSSNLAALRKRQPEVAASIDSATGPPARLVQGRDGTPTFLVDNKEGAAWLGGSSMPSVSAEEIGRGFAGHESAFLPGIMSGCEVLHLAGRLSRHAAIFVIERSPFELQLALRLHGFAPLIERGQLVFLLDEGLESRLLTLFQAFPGYLLPGRLLTLPHRAPAEQAELQRRVERAGAQVARQQAEELSRLGAEIASSAKCQSPCAAGAVGGGSQTCRLAILSTDASEATRVAARRLAAAAKRLGWEHACCIPELPGQCHTLARWRCLQEVTAERVIMVNSAPGPLRGQLPSDLPIFSWYFASEQIQADVVPAWAPRDCFIVSSKAQQAQLLSAGVPEEILLYAGVTADDDCREEGLDATSSGSSAVSQSSAREREGDRCVLDVVLLGDVPDDRPEAAGITLSTHAALWRECLKVAAECASRTRKMEAHEVLSLGEKRGGAKLSDPRIRAEVIQKIEERALPAAFARHLASELARRFEVGFQGLNWPGASEKKACTASGCTGTQQDKAAPRDELQVKWSGPARRARLTVLPFFSTAAVQMAVDMLAAGGSVALRAGHSPLLEIHPELRKVAKFIPTFTDSKQLLDVVAKGRSWSDDEVRQGLGSLWLSTVLKRVVGGDGRALSALHAGAKRQAARLV